MIEPPITAEIHDATTLEDVRDAAWRFLDAISSEPGWLCGRSYAELRALAQFRFVLERCRP